MSESLLSFSEVLLFGRLLHDLKIKTAKATADVDARLLAIDKIPLKTDLSVADDTIDGTTVANDDLVLVVAYGKKRAGLYKVVVDAGDPNKYQLNSRTKVDEDDLVKITDGDDYSDTYWEQVSDTSGAPFRQEFKFRKQLSEKLGANKQLKDQYGDNARLARIYGFSYEGTYFDLPEPTVFLVHGKGVSATDGNKPGDLASRAPNDPSLSGVAAADFQIADDIRVWNYDKADYTIRMDVMTGQFEQVLLDIFFGFDSPAISGAKVSGAKVSGAKVSGAKVSGAKVSGAKVSGAKARGD